MFSMRPSRLARARKLARSAWSFHNRKLTAVFTNCVVARNAEYPRGGGIEVKYLPVLKSGYEERRRVAAQQLREPLFTFPGAQLCFHREVA